MKTLIRISIALILLLMTPFAVQTQEPTNNLAVLSATYLGGAGDDAATAIDFTAAGHVILAGTMPGHTPGNVSETALLGGGAGVLVQLDDTGQTVQAVTRIGQTVTDMQVGETGRIVVCGDFGVALLNPAADAVLWSASLGEISRCAIGGDNVVVGLVDGSPDTLHVYDAAGASLGSWNTGSTGRHWLDVVVDSARTQIISTGYEQVSGDLQVAFINAHSYSGDSRLWEAYDFSSSAVSNENLGADTRGRRVVLGADGLLYFTGSINGGTGASIFARDPQNISQSAGDRTVAYDNYNRPTNVGSVKMTWYGRYNPADGALMLGQSLLTRLNNGGGNSILAHALAADADGRLYVVGEAYARMKDRDSRQVAGITVGGYSGGEPFLLIVAPDFQTRIVWTPFTAPGGSAGGSPARGVAVRDGLAALAVDLNADRQLITHQALQDSAGGGTDAYVAIWPQIGELQRVYLPLVLRN